MLMEDNTILSLYFLNLFHIYSVNLFIPLIIKSTFVYFVCIIDSLYNIVYNIVNFCYKFLCITTNFHIIMYNSTCLFPVFGI